MQGRESVHFVAVVAVAVAVVLPLHFRFCVFPKNHVEQLKNRCGKKGEKDSSHGKFINEICSNA